MLCVLISIASSIIYPNYPKSTPMGFFSKGLKNEFETAVVNEPSVFEPLKLYCSCLVFLNVFFLVLWCDAFVFICFVR